MAIKRKNFSLSNFYALELLDQLYYKSEPSQTEIDDVERNLTQVDFIFYKDGLPIIKNTVYRALIISSDILERNILITMLRTMHIDADCVTSIEEFYGNSKNYNLYFLSEALKAGFNAAREKILFLKEKQKQEEKEDKDNVAKLFLIISNDETKEVSKKMNADAVLEYPFYFKQFKEIMADYFFNTK